MTTEVSNDPGDTASSKIDKTASQPSNQHKEVKADTKPSFDLISITTHRQLITEQQAIFRRFNNHPELAKLLFINPVLAFKEVGVNMSREIAHHVLHTLQHTPHMRRRRDELEAKIKEVLKEVPQPDNPQWVSYLLFEKLQLQPLATRGHKPIYQHELSDEALARLQALRPMPRKRYQPTSRQSQGMIVRVRTSRTAVRRLDLDAELPKLKPSDKAPKTVSLETLFFYKDSHPLIRDVLELGIIQRRSFPIHTGDSYRKIKEGQKQNAFHTWIKAVRFPEEQENELDG